MTRDALAAAVPGSAMRATCLSNLADFLRVLSGQADDPALLAEAARAAEEAVAATAADQPDRTGHLLNLGYVLVAQATQADDPVTLTRARRCFAEAARNTAAPVLRRIRCYRESANLAAATGGTALEALDELESAVRLLPLATTRTLSPTPLTPSAAT